MNADELRIDPFRVAAGGDSAGGNMAGSMSLRYRKKIAMQFLIVPCLQIFNFRTTSFLENTESFSESINSPSSVVFVLNYLRISPELLRLLGKQSYIPSFEEISVRWIREPIKMDAR